MRKSFLLMLAMIFLLSLQGNVFSENTPKIKLGSDLLLSKYQHVIEGKNIGLITNQTGVNSEGKHILNVLSEYPKVNLKAVYTPEHGLDGKAKAGAYVESYTHPTLNIPVYSLYGKTRMPSNEMLQDIDVLIFDIQDIGARTYTYISTLNYFIIATKQNNKSIIVLDRPNPLSGEIVDGPVLEERFQTFVGVDILPMAHGMTIGELAHYFNRKIGGDLTVIPMEGYSRSMVFQDTGLTWIPSSPNIPDLASVMGYMATGLGEGTGIVQKDKFKWIGGKGLNPVQFAEMLNSAKLPGVSFTPEEKDGWGGVRLDITDPHLFNPAKTGIYALAYAHTLNPFEVPISKDTVVMFDKIMGTNKIGQYLIAGLSPQEIEAKYGEDLNRFKEERKKFLIYGQTTPVQPKVRKVQLEGGLSIHNKSYVPLKSVLQEFGYQIGWLPVTKQVYAEKPGKKIVIETVMSPMKVWVNGTEIKSKDIVPMIKEGTTFIPAQFIPWIEKSQQKTVGNQIQIHSTNLDIVVGIPVKQPFPKKESGKIAYLTFDDGPSSITPQVLDVLKENGVKATFFVIGRNIKGHESVLKRAVAEGHAIGGHSYSHNYEVIYHDVDAFFKDIEKGQEVIEQVIGKKTTIFRFPGGSNNTVSKKTQDPKVYSQGKWIMSDLVKEAQSRGYHYYDWNVSIGDASAQGYTPESALMRVQEGITSKKDLVILSHDSTPKMNTVKALPNIIKLLKDEGYSFGTLDREVEGFAFIR